MRCKSSMLSFITYDPCHDLIHQRQHCGKRGTIYAIKFDDTDCNMRLSLLLFWGERGCGGAQRDLTANGSCSSVVARQKQMDGLSRSMSRLRNVD